MREHDPLQTLQTLQTLQIDDRKSEYLLIH